MDDLPGITTRQLYVISDTLQDGVHKILVQDFQKMGNTVSNLTYWVDDETIHIRGVTRTSLGYDNRFQISGVKIINIQAPDKQIIWRRRHTGFQTQKIW